MRKFRQLLPGFRAQRPVSLSNVRLMHTIYRVGDRVIFTRGHQRLTGKILAIGVSGGDQRRVVIETDVADLSGKMHHGNVIVLYKNIVGLAEETSQAEMEEEWTSR